MPRSQDQHVIRSGTGWAVRPEGEEKISARFETERAAVHYAEEVARKKKSQAKIHGRDGVIRLTSFYGTDPFPPRDKR